MGVQGIIYQDNKSSISPDRHNILEFDFYQTKLGLKRFQWNRNHVGGRSDEAIAMGNILGYAINLDELFQQVQDKNVIMI